MKLFEWIEVEHKHMMATKAMCKLGDISADDEDPELCLIYGEFEDNWVGQWVYGMGFFDVKFPKETTSELTKEEFDKYNGTGMRINSTPIKDLQIAEYKEYEDE